MKEIVGTIERITFQNTDTGYTVAKIDCRDHKDLICIVGAMPLVQPGETVRCCGEWRQHLVYGRQFEVENYKTEAPSDILGIRKYLGSGLIKGIGPVYASRIVDTFGVFALDIIDNDPDRLKEIPGLGKVRINKIKSCWSEQKTIREVMIFLQSVGVSPGYAQKIFKVYGKKAIEIVKENPYTLAKDIFGIGFKSADAIAQKMGIDKDSPGRIDAGIEYVLSQLSNNGHCCYPVAEFLPEAQAILEVAENAIEERLSKLQLEERIVVAPLVVRGENQRTIWLRPLFLSEVGIAREIQRLRNASCHLRNVDTERALQWVQEQLDLQLALAQKEAVQQSLVSKIQIITGGPGTGKSTITKAILVITEKLTGNILLAAPTGRAAKRMTEITGKKASTIHSLLKFDFKIGRFKHGRKLPLECDLIIIDEASMIDTSLMYSLLKAIPDHARIIFVGDTDQLPSVGPGTVLRDIISSNQVPMTLLTQIFRQAAGSRIITNAHKINKGHFPDIRNQQDSDFFFSEKIEKEEVLDAIIPLVTHRLPQRYGFSAIDDIQVLTPMRRGVIGTENLNRVLQEALNPSNDPLLWCGQRFHSGDKVMQIRNNYQKEVFNGDVGRIKKIDPVEQVLTLTMGNREIAYEFSDLDELVLAYAVSVHKYQGSECPCVVMPIHTSHYKLLHRNLLYTAVTRGKQLVVLVGTKKALAIAVHNDEVKQRYTGLKQAVLSRMGV